MKRKILSLFLCSMILSAAVSGCDTDKSTADTSLSLSTVEETTEAPTAQVSETEYKTMEPPEDGWTIEELMSVTYICGKQLTYPLTMEYLGEDFSLDETNQSNLKLSIGFPLLYQNKEIGRVYFKKDSIKPSSYGYITAIMFKNATTYNTDCVVVNGISLGSSNIDVKSMIGIPCTESTDSRYTYNNQNGDEKFLDIILLEEKDVYGINLYLERE